MDCPFFQELGYTVTPGPGRYFSTVSNGENTYHCHDAQEEVEVFVFLRMEHEKKKNNMNKGEAQCQL